MTVPSGETLGCPVEEIDTPALLLDHEVLERNIARMAAFAAKAGVALRPHAKTHKSPLVARLQIAAGAVGVCCQKLGEAEVMAAGGVADILIANEIVGDAKLDRLAALARVVRLTVAVDNAEAAAALSRAVQRHRSTVGVVVDVDVGQGRCGVAPGAAARELARSITPLPGLVLRGVQGYHGTIQHIQGAAARAERARQANAALLETAALLRADGFDLDLVTGAGTGTYATEGAAAGMTEIQPGSYVFMDRQYREIGGVGGPVYDAFDPAISVLATVMSLPAPDRAVTDAGHKALSSDAGLPLLLDRPGWVFGFGGDEHGVLRAEGAAAPFRLGEKVRILPSHCDTTVNLFDCYHVVRDGRLAAVWPIAARGRTR